MSPHNRPNRPLFFALMPLVLMVVGDLLMPSILGLYIFVGVLGLAGLAGLMWSWWALVGPSSWRRRTDVRNFLLICGCLVVPVGIWLAYDALQKHCGGRPMGAGGIHVGLCSVLYGCLAIFFLYCEKRGIGWRPAKPASWRGTLVLVLAGWAVFYAVAVVPWQLIDNYVDNFNEACEKLQDAAGTHGTTGLQSTAQSGLNLVDHDYA